jgi:hypothetical protein
MREETIVSTALSSEDRLVLFKRREAERLAPFDYSTMAAGIADDARKVAERLRKRTKAYVIDTGRDLLALKDRIEHGLFGRWIEAELGVTPRTAQNMMQAAAAFGDKSEIVSHLPPTTLYQLASPSTPQPVREGVIQRLAAGEKVTAAAVASEISTARHEAKEAERKAKITPEEKERRKRAEARWKREVEKNRAEMQAQHEARMLATARLAVLMTEALGPRWSDADALLRELKDFKLSEAMRHLGGEAQKLAPEELAATLARVG